MIVWYKKTEKRPVQFTNELEFKICEMRTIKTIKAFETFKYPLV